MTKVYKIDQALVTLLKKNDFFIMNVVFKGEKDMLRLRKPGCTSMLIRIENGKLQLLYRHMLVITTDRLTLKDLKTLLFLYVIKKRYFKEFIPGSGKTTLADAFEKIGSLKKEQEQLKSQITGKMRLKVLNRILEDWDNFEVKL